MRHPKLSAAIIAALTLVACNRGNKNAFQVQTATIGRRDIVVTAQATGTVTPVDTVPVKAQASGIVMKMPVDVGSQVKPGDLLVQLDTRLSQYDYDRTVAAERARLLRTWR